MTRDDLSFLIEKGAGMVFLVIGLDWLPDLIDVWFAGIGSEDPKPREAAIRTLVPLAAGVFLLMRRKPAEVAAAAAPPPSAMTRADWLWVGCKLLGAVAMLYGAGNFVLHVAWATSAAPEFPVGAMAGSIAYSAIHVIGGAWLFFGTRAWRFACRE